MFSLKEVENKVIVLQIPSCLENSSGSSLVFKDGFVNNIEDIWIVTCEIVS